ncbi:Uncharacterised protein [Chlamydia trachomatis]|nr:Uncharacterised protein [Chlamydia trachomatis]
MRDDKYYVGLFYLLFYEFMNIVFYFSFFKNFMEFIFKSVSFIFFFYVYM